MRSQYCAQYSEVYKCTDASIAPSGYKGKALIYILKFPETGYDTERYVSDFIRYDKYNVAKFLEDISDFNNVKAYLSFSRCLNSIYLGKLGKISGFMFGFTANYHYNTDGNLISATMFDALPEFDKYDTVNIIDASTILSTPHTKCSVVPREATKPLMAYTHSYNPLSNCIHIPPVADTCERLQFNNVSQVDGTLTKGTKISINITELYNSAITLARTKVNTPRGLQLVFKYFTESALFNSSWLPVNRSHFAPDPDKPFREITLKNGTVITDNRAYIILQHSFQPKDATEVDYFLYVEDLLECALLEYGAAIINIEDGSMMSYEQYYNSVSSKTIIRNSLDAAANALGISYSDIDHIVLNLTIV